MKIVALIVRILLGLVFFLFGLNGFVRFLPIPAYHGAAQEFLQLLISTRYIFAVKAIEVVGGALLLSGLFVPLALTLLGPVVVNIFLFHFLVYRSQLAVPVVIGLLWAFLLWTYRQYFLPLFVQRANPCQML